MRSQTFFSLVAVATCVSGKPFVRRDVIPHDTVEPFEETVQDGAIGDTIRRFEPYLNIANGCQSYPAVDADGNTSSGLEDEGGETDNCEDDTKGQTYARAGEYNDRWAIMYSWYMPKDQPLDNLPIGSHRHDWENVVVWVDDANSPNASLIGGAASAHGEYKKTTEPQTENGTRVKVGYFSEFPTNHELEFTDDLGRDLPLVDWDAIPQASRDALESTDFGDATVPFKEDQFLGKLEEAYDLEG
ncbi:hypothetical protein FQN54_002171 [Arachnomyces sp. PD_36]|nr:hypothetical protein FQN54_002171 [Arachnomyces sp. PD_36]